jgi:hypothetical protein
VDNTKFEQMKLDQFLERARAFLAEDPYWMHVLTMEGGRAKRKQVAREFAKQMTTIPHFQGPGHRKERRAVGRLIENAKPRTSTNAESEPV